MSSTSPVLKRAAKVKNQADKSTVIEHLGQEIVLEGAGAELFRKIAPHLNGKETVEEIAKKTGEPVERVKGLSRQLIDAGVLGDPSSNAFSSMTGLEFHALHRKYVTSWLEPVYAHPLWEKMFTGLASRAQIIGFAFEKYHYIEGAHEHMGVAAANATLTAISIAKA
jgi:hypothetical protein